MNIKEAKEEIIRTVRAYLQKDELGTYVIPPERQRPVLLIGPPGVGKTAVMRQIAEEMNINLVSYTITHHTRQSAIGLPFIARKEYGGEEHAVTEYTMSEIVASVYDQIERSGIREGILFLDEINCVSETLAPTMLQFLQYKMFGTHRVPEGFVLVTAGNPPEYNRSVRDFDIVTLDRVKRIDVTADFPVWKEYAYQAGIHGAITAYLEIRKEHFCRVTNDPDGRHFVTPRAWEDLSDSLRVYESLYLPVGRELIAGFIQDPEVMKSFSVYYELWNRYRTVYRIPDILDGTVSGGEESLKGAAFDEKLSLIGLLISALGGEFMQADTRKEVQRELFGIVKGIRDDLRRERDAEGLQTESGSMSRSQNGGQDGAAGSGEMEGCRISVPDRLRIASAGLQREIGAKRAARMLPRGKERIFLMAVRALDELAEKVAGEGSGDTSQDYELMRSLFAERETERKAFVLRTGEKLENAFHFLAETFGEGQEMVVFLSELSASPYAMKFIQEHGSPEYDRQSRLLLLKDRRQALREELFSLSEGAE
ncbi:MAG: AAA family ATPase [Lachnospiraceae bacterium]|nr:AAA family ATPase [Lachnospiraceae bacterium]